MEPEKTMKRSIKVVPASSSMVMKWLKKDRKAIVGVDICISKEFQ